MRQDDGGSDVKMIKYVLEFILQSRNTAGDSLKNRLAEFGEQLQIFEPEGIHDQVKDFRVNIITEDPAVIFDICSQFGRIKTVKINEMI